MKILLFLLLTPVLFFGCKEPNKDKTDKSVFRYNEASGISSLDPAFAKGQADIWACNQLFNGLVQMNDKLEVVPCIASSWDISDDGKLYTFYLRNDVFFHDHQLFENGKGRKVKATDFVYSFNRIPDPSVASPGSWVFNNVLLNANGKPAFNAIGDSIFTIELINPFPPFLGLLTSQYCSVIPHEAITHFGKEFRKNPIGTGPFKFKTWEERTALIFLKNEHYFEFENGNRLPYVDAVSISFLSDRQAAFLEFVKGNLDFISGIDASYKDELLTRTGGLREKYRDKFKMETGPYLNTEYLGCMVDPALSDPKSNPLMNVNIRKAINHGFDRVKMITYLRNGMGTPGIYGMVPQGLPSFDSTAVTGYNYNTTLTSELLKEAGFPGGANLPATTMSTTKEYQDLCEFIQGQLRESGIQIKLEVNQGAAHREMVAKQKLSFFRGSWIADYPDAETFLTVFYGQNPAPPNYTGFSDATFDQLYINSLSETDNERRLEMHLKMNEILIEESPVIFLFYDETARFINRRVSGLPTHAFNYLDLLRVELK